MRLSCWQDRRDRADHEADVAVVGAGFSGAAVAWWLTRSGLGVMVLDQAYPGAGASGAGRGRIAPAGDLSGEGIREAARSGREWLLRQVGPEREHRIALVADPGGGVRLDPRRLVELLLEDVVEGGGRLLSGAPVVAVSATSPGVALQCPGCTVRAEAAVLAAGVGLAALAPAAARDLRPDRQELWGRPAGDTWEVGARAPPPPEATHRWRRERLLTGCGLPGIRRIAPAVLALAGVREEHWDLGFYAARRLVETLTDGRDPDPWLAWPRGE